MQKRSKVQKLTMKKKKKKGVRIYKNVKKTNEKTGTSSYLFINNNLERKQTNFPN